MVPPPKPGVGPRRIWSDSKGLLWVSFWHTGEVGRYDPTGKTWKVWALPKSKCRLLCGLCRRQGQGLADRLARQCDPALRSDDREVRELPEQQARRLGAPDARPAGRSLGRGIRHRPAGGGAGLTALGFGVVCRSIRPCSRRDILRILAGGAALAAGVTASAGRRSAHRARLIAEARGLEPTVTAHRFHFRARCAARATRATR